MRPRVLLADDHVLVIDGLRRILEPECEVVGAVEDGRSLLRAAERLKPDIVLLDISMPLLNGVEAARRLRKIVPAAKLIFVTMHADATYVTGAFRAGASGYVLKRCASMELVSAIQEVLKGRTYITPLIRRDVLGDAHAGKEIAAILNISRKTVAFHKSNLMRRLGLRSTAELTKYALEHGISGT
jgi:DNA-binding NarL/FixJ family response regulator